MRTGGRWLPAGAAGRGARGDRAVRGAAGTGLLRADVRSGRRSAVPSLRAGRASYLRLDVLRSAAARLEAVLFEAVRGSRGSFPDLITDLPPASGRSGPSARSGRPGRSGRRWAAAAACSRVRIGLGSGRVRRGLRGRRIRRGLRRRRIRGRLGRCRVGGGLGGRVDRCCRCCGLSGGGIGGGLSGGGCRGLGGRIGRRHRAGHRGRLADHRPGPASVDHQHRRVAGRHHARARRPLRRCAGWRPAVRRPAAAPRSSTADRWPCSSPSRSACPPRRSSCSGTAPRRCRRRAARSAPPRTAPGSARRRPACPDRPAWWRSSSAGDAGGARTPGGRRPSSRPAGGCRPDSRRRPAAGFSEVVVTMLPP